MQKDDLISRQAALDALREKVFHELTDEFYGAMQVLDELPPVDAVPVVRCKDCKNWDERRGRKYCWEMYFDQSDPDFYCGYAERRKDG